MSNLIDTCSISEWVKNKPDSNIVKWFCVQDEHSMYVRAIIAGESGKGIEKIPDWNKEK
jgi:toxin FitB